MPWDGTELWVAPLADSGEERLVAGGREESVFQPEWGPDGRLHFVSDRDGWWNLYRAREPGAELSGEEGTLVQLTEEQADFAHPQWLFGGATYAFLESGAIACVRTEGAEERLVPAATRGLGTGRPRASVHLLRLSRALGAGRAGRLRRRQPRERDRGRRLRRRERCDRGGARPPARSRSTPPTSRGRGRSSSRPARARSPTASTTRRANPEFEAPAGELPPLIVESHGGPTSHATPALDARVPLLDQPRDRRRRRQLPRQQRLRPRVPQQAARHLGRGRQRGLRQRGAPPGRGGRGRRRRGWRSAAARPAATRPSARSPSTTASPPGRATSASPTPRRWPRTPTSSSRATSTC